MSATMDGQDVCIGVCMSVHGLAESPGKPDDDFLNLSGAISFQKTLSYFPQWAVGV